MNKLESEFINEAFILTKKELMVLLAAFDENLFRIKIGENLFRYKKGRESDI